MHAPDLTIRRATLDEATAAQALLIEVAQWLVDRGQALWLPRELDPAIMHAAAERGELFVGYVGNTLAATMLVQNDDPVFWPDIDRVGSCFLHRLVVKRSFAGQGISQAMVRFAEAETRDRGRAWLRLDCDPRPELMAFYEQLDFTLRDRGEFDGFAACRWEKRVAD